jgi:hypothetical protein
MSSSVSSFGNRLNSNLTRSNAWNGQFRLEWTPDSMTNIMFRPNFSYSKNDGTSLSNSATFDSDPYEYSGDPLREVREIAEKYGIVKNYSLNDGITYSDSKNLRGMLQFNRRLNNNGRNITIQFNANWGGYSFIPSQALKPYYGIEATNMPSIWNVDNMFVYQDVKDADGNVLVKENRDAAYPSLAYASINGEQSNFWRVSGTQVRLNRLTIAYRIPQKFTKKLGINNLRFNITGQNLLSFYNPMPDSFYNPMGGNYGSYPRLRKWTIGVNATF